MAEADASKQIILRAIELATEAQVMFEGNVDQSLIEVQADMNALVKTIEQAQRNILAAIPKLRDAKETASQIVRGTSGMASEAIQFLDLSETDATDNLQKLQFMRTEIQRMQVNTANVMTRDNKTIVGRIKSAIGYLRGLANVL